MYANSEPQSNPEFPDPMARTLYWPSQSVCSLDIRLAFMFVYIVDSFDDGVIMLVLFTTVVKTGEYSDPKLEKV